MKVYVSGPMTGIPEFNFPAFNAAAACLRARGFEVVNPAEMDAADQSPKAWHEYLRRDIAELVKCDAIYVLRGYETSRGACLELTIAKELGMQVMYEQRAVEGGIYAIVGPGPRMYVGQSHNLARRWIEHRSALRGNRHHCASLQRAWNKYGESAFKFVPMAIMRAEDRSRIEQGWFDAVGRGLYNSSLHVEAPQLGRKHTPETRAKMSAAHKGKPHGPMSAERKMQMSIARTGKYRGANSPHYGKPKSAEHRANLSRGMKGRYVGEKALRSKPVKCRETGYVFKTSSLAVDWLRANGAPKANLSTFRKAVKAKRPAYGYTWHDVQDGVGMEEVFLMAEAA